MDLLIYVILLVAIAVGFFLGRLHAKRSALTPNSAPLAAHQRYLEGLTFLLREQPDAAIDTLVAELEVSVDTFEIYLALGALWRKRGEMDRAIRVHQALMEASALTKYQRQQVQMELALDYTYSGVLDRGEILLKELVHTAPPAVREAAGKALVLLYQEEQEWNKAIVAVDELCGRGELKDEAHWRHLQVHYYCELAERELSGPEWNQPCASLAGSDLAVNLRSAMDLLEQAAHRVTGHPRVLMLKAVIALGLGDKTTAQRVLSGIHSETGINMALVPLCYGLGGEQAEQRLQAIYERTGDVGIIPFLAEFVQTSSGHNAAVAFVSAELQKHEGVERLSYVLKVCEMGSSGNPLLLEALHKALPLEFHCRHCGFLGRQFYWCCPSCKSWL